MKGKYGATAKRAKAKRPASRLPWVVAIALVGVITILGSLYAWAEQQAQGEVRGKIVVERSTQDIGTVPFSGGLAKASYALTAQGGPVVVKGISTT